MPMSADVRSRRPSANTEREARRLGWYAGCAVTWREFLEQYPYGLDVLAKDRRSMSDAA
jgi:hypothetical protein